MRILLIGKNGQIGWELERTLAPMGEIIAPGRQELDLNDQRLIRHSIRRVRPDFIVNAAAYTDVDKAESETELAMAVNAFAPGILAEEAARIKATLVHYSTDYVFDGTKKEPYTEDDIPNPLNFYGKTKLIGEEAIRQTEAPHLILRTGWVYGLRGKNFFLTMRDLASKCEELTVVNDQFGAPTWCRQIAEATAQLITRISFRKTGMNGLYHLTAAGETTWFGFAEAIFRQIGGGKLCTPNIRAINTEDYPTPALRPQYSLLDNSLIREHHAIKLLDWQQQLMLVFG